MSSPELSELTAVANGLVYEMDPSYMVRQGRTVLQAVNFMSGILYPEMSENASSDPASTAEEGNSGEDSSTASESSDTSASSESSPSSDSESASSSSGSSGTELQVGDTGDEVLQLQERLAELGYFVLEPTGEFGEGTEQALMNFQLYNGLLATGIANEETLEILYSSNAVTFEEAEG